MLKFAIAALVTFGLVLLTSGHPATAKSEGLETTYTWGFAGIGNPQVVCKQIEMVPQHYKIRHSESQPVSVHSTVVGDRFCAPSAKPAM